MQELLAAKAIHKKRAAAFFEYLKDDDSDLLLVSFDCEKNQPLPKVPDSAAYYSRQIYLHNFTAVIGHSRSALTKENVKCFCWCENQFKKNANLIASCIFYLLKKIDLGKFKRVRLMADGCGGQNKNTIFVTMAMLWLGVHAPSHIEEVTLIFPVTGHSFIPPDRVFGLIEREVKKHDVILNPEELLQIIGKFGDVINVGESVPVLDFKSSMKGVVKNTQSWPFQISQMKRLILHRKNEAVVEIKGEPFYKHEVANFTSVFVKKRTAANIRPVPISETNSVNKDKKNDVENLLTKHFGSQWRNDARLHFFITILDTDAGQSSRNNGGQQMENEDEDPDQPECDYRQESVQLIV